MSFNIVDLVKDQVKGQLIGQMGNLLGNEGGKATSAVDSMVPAMLNGLTGSAGTTEGANSLFGAVQNQDDSLLDNMSSLLGGGQASTVIDNGNSVLSSLFGSGGLGKLAGALSGFSGLSKGGTSSMMGMLAPIILGVIKRKVMGEGLNAGGLASMLTGQSNNISASMPSGLTDQLNTSGFLSSFGNAGAGVAAGAAGAVAAGAASVAGGARNVAGSAADAAGNVRDGVADAAGNARDGVANAAGNVRDGVANAAGDARDGVANVAGNARDGVANVAGNARDGVANAAGNARDGVANAAGTTANTVEHGAKKGGSFLRWLAPLAILGALAWAAFTFLLPGAKDAATGAADKASEGAAAVTDTAKDATASATEAATGAVATATEAASDATASAAEAIDPGAFGDQIGGLFSSATDTLSGVTDADSAKAAIPALGELGTKVDDLSGMMSNLPETAMGPIGDIATKGMGTLQPVVDKVLALPGVGSILSPVVGPIMEKLQGLSPDN